MDMEDLECDGLAYCNDSSIHHMVLRETAENVRQGTCLCAWIRVSDLPDAKQSEFRLLQVTLTYPNKLPCRRMGDADTTLRTL